MPFNSESASLGGQKSKRGKSIGTLTVVTLKNY
jgi:hypothetical protein